MTRFFLALGLLTSMAGAAAANGRSPGVLDVRVKGSTILASTTFGLVASKNDGADWHWTCESAFGSGGVFDPDFEPSKTSSDVFTTALDGLLVTHDDCTYGASSLGDRFISSVAIASNGTIFAAASDNEGSKIYRSTDNGVSFPEASPAFRNFDSWRSLEVAPSDPMRVYAAGIRLVFGQPKKFLLYRSLDGGVTFVEMQLPSLTNASPNAVLFIAGISATDPDLIYARLTEADGMTGEELFRSTDAGETWTSILTKADSLYAFVVRGDGDLIVGTPNSGAFRSTDQGATFTPLTGAPHLNCLTESADVLYGCTQNYGAEGDDAAVMKSADGGATWTKVLRFQDIQGPVACAAGTVQKDFCEAMEWCGMREQLGITSTAIDCAAADGGPPMPDSGGCCDTDGRPQSLLLAGLAVLLIAFGRRRRAAR